MTHATPPREEPFHKKCLKSLAYKVAGTFPVRPCDSVQAAALCQALLNHGIATTMGKLSKRGDDSAGIVREYQDASNALAATGASAEFYLSVKPPALQFREEYALAIAATARGNGHGVHFDAHAFPEADPTLELLDAVMRREKDGRGAAGWRFGLTLPSRWKRSLTDARWVAERGVRPRLVKGDFAADPRDEAEPVRGLLALADLLAGKVPEVALATHDGQVAREVVARCGKRGTAVQLEIFFGMPSSAMLALSKELAVPVRIYVPYGDTLLAYLVRDLLLNPHKLFRSNAAEVLGSQEAKLARIVRFR